MPVPIRLRLTRTLLAIAVTVLAFAGAMAICTGLADYWSGVAQQRLVGSSSSDSLSAQDAWRRALSFRPDVAAYWRDLAMADAFPHPHAAERAVQRALELNPQSVNNWYSLGLLEFQLGHSEASLNALHQAVLHDPAGAQVHYEFANLARALGRQQLFRTQLQAAANVMGASLVFAVLSSAAADGYTKSELAALLSSSNPLTRAFGILYFTNHHDWETASLVFANLAPCVGTFPMHMCSDAAHQLLAGLTSGAKSGAMAQRTELVARAQQVWDHAVALGLLQGGPAKRGAIADPDFRYPRAGVLFSWRDTGILPVVTENDAAPAGGNGVRFDFSGVDGQQGSLLEQDLWVVPGRLYRISLVSRDQATPQQTGVTADVVATPGGVLASVALVLTAPWSESELTFRAPLETPVVTFQIQYNRPNGQTLLHSPVEAAQVRLTPLEGKP